MNALVGQEAKANFSVLAHPRRRCGRWRPQGWWRFHQHGRWRTSPGRCEFEVLHDGSEELQPSGMVSLIFRSGWQRRVIERLGITGPRPLHFTSSVPKMLVWNRLPC